MNASAFDREPIVVAPTDQRSLPAINRVIEDAVASWPLPSRLKKLALPLLRYDAIDANDYEFLLAGVGERAVGVAAWDRSLIFAADVESHDVLLHGLYVAAPFQRSGVGRQLQAAVFARAAAAGAAGVVVKAERVAAPYFESCGYERVDGSRYGFSYPYSYRHPLPGRAYAAA
jgi:GNAT superfamily N-acetyltransferase